MIKATDLLGKSIVIRDTGEEKEKILDLIIDATKSLVDGLLVDKEGLLSSRRMVAFADILAFGEEAVLVQSEEDLAELENEEELIRFEGSAHPLIGTTLMTEAGEDLGTIVDLHFDEDSGQIMAYEATSSLLADTYAGHSIPAQSRSGEEFRTSMAEYWEELKGQVNKLKEKATQEYEESRIKKALGRPVNKVILDKQGQPILEAGQLITSEAIERARQAGMLDLLLSSVYDAQPGRSREGLRVKKSK